MTLSSQIPKVQALICWDEYDLDRLVVHLLSIFRRVRSFTPAQFNVYQCMTFQRCPQKPRNLQKEAECFPSPLPIFDVFFHPSFNGNILQIAVFRWASTAATLCFALRKLAKECQRSSKAAWTGSKCRDFCLEVFWIFLFFFLEPYRHG